MPEDRYSLVAGPTVDGYPMAIFEMRFGNGVRLIADLRGPARPTMEEARCMVAALNAAKLPPWPA